MQPRVAGDLPPGSLDPREAAGCRGRSHVCPSPSAPPQHLALPRAAPLCLSSPVSSQAGASQRCPRAHSPLPCGTLPPWTYQELVADSEPPHCRCSWRAGTAPPASPGHRPGVNVQPRRPLPGHRCVTGWVWIPAACPGSWGSGMCPPCAGMRGQASPSSQVLGGRWLSPLLHPSYRLEPSREPRGHEVPLFWHHRGRSCRVALCNTTVAMVVATANTCVVGVTLAGHQAPAKASLTALHSWAEQRKYSNMFMS